MQIDYNSPSSIKSFLLQNALAVQKKFGQNFLVSEAARKKIVSALEIKKGDAVWEVGAGLGAMTRELLFLDAKVAAFEIDRGFSLALKKIFSEEIERGAFKLIEGDVLKNWKEEFQKSPPKFLFGNLPYNIAAAFVAATIEGGARFEKCVFTVQKEVAIRMTEKEGCKNYSSLSVLCQWAYDAKAICDLSRANFFPRPGVDSRAILLLKKKDFPSCKNAEFFVRMQRSLFSKRRKTVKNNLEDFLQKKNADDLAKEILFAAGIPQNERAENLSVKKLLLLSDLAYDAIM